MNRRLTKVKYKPGKGAYVEYEVLHNEKWDTHTMRSNDTPEPEFVEALQALAPDVADLCELCPGCATGIVVQGVSLCYAGEDGVMGATITALRNLDSANSPLVLNTPHKPECAEDGKTPTLSAQCCQHIDALEVAAWGYVDGNRVQMMFAFGMGQDLEDKEGLSALMDDVRSGVVTLEKTMP